MSNATVVVLLVPKFITNNSFYLIKDLYVKKKREKGETEVMKEGKNREREKYLSFSFFFFS
jgi:hypothetical protein